LESGTDCTIDANKSTKRELTSTPLI
jgi:hypothetical protein